MVKSNGHRHRASHPNYRLPTKDRVESPREDSINLANQEQNERRVDLESRGYVKQHTLFENKIHTISLSNDLAKRLVQGELNMALVPVYALDGISYDVYVKKE